MDARENTETKGEMSSLPVASTEPLQADCRLHIDTQGSARPSENSSHQTL